MMAASFVALVEENSELCLHLSALVEGVFQCVTTVHKTIRNDLEGARLDDGSNQIVFWAEDNKCVKLFFILALIQQYKLRRKYQRSGIGTRSPAAPPKSMSCTSAISVHIRISRGWRLTWLDRSFCA